MYAFFSFAVVDVIQGCRVPIFLEGASVAVLAYLSQFCCMIKLKCLISVPNGSK